jgi:phosphonate metabolism protein PhnN/1,5-bisphosphokinase (PRPP-forming)
MIGMLVLVVGPSGSGKDTLMAGAKAALAADGSVVFARRVITRSASAGGEDHEPVSPPEFARRLASGGFLLAWEAHGLSYGIPIALTADLAMGRTVVANVSRRVIDDAARRCGRVGVIEITAPAEVRAKRLVERGRESEMSIAERLSRAGEPLPQGVQAETVMNDGSREEGIKRFLAALDRMRR